eukprot:m.293732 g.293732  ORF g.293732 m.293732 type:complete len:1094 (+) comp40740_c0_seq29:402-3683(+)
MKAGSAEASFLRLDIVGKDNAGKSSLRKSLTNQKFDSNEPSTVGIDFDPKCEILVLESCNWKTSLNVVGHLGLFERAVSSEMASQTKSTATARIAEEAKMQKREKRREQRLKRQAKDLGLYESQPKVFRQEGVKSSDHSETDKEADIAAKFIDATYHRNLSRNKDNFKNMSEESTSVFTKDSSSHSSLRESNDQDTQAPGSFLSSFPTPSDIPDNYLHQETEIGRGSASNSSNSGSSPNRKKGEKKLEDSAHISEILPNEIPNFLTECPLESMTVDEDQNNTASSGLDPDPYTALPESVSKQACTYLKDGPSHWNARREIYIDMLDYGGQDVFYATHYLYLSKEAIYLAVFDASIPLDEESLSEFRQFGQEPLQIDVLPGETYYDRLEEWISAIHLMQPPDERTVLHRGSSEHESPLVFLVGTHKDKALETPGLLKKQDDFLRRKLEGKSFWKHVVEASKDCVFFAVDNTKSDPENPDDEDEDVKRLQLRAEETAKQLTGTHKVPIKFLRFERYIREMKLTHSRKATSLKFLRAIANAIAEIKEEDEFQLAIRYLSNRAVILYHDLPGPHTEEADTILDPGWLAQVMQKLITVPSKIPARYRNNVMRSKQKGIVTKEFVDYQLEEIESKGLIIKLMQYFDLLCDYYCLDPQVGQGEDKKYLIDPERPETDDLVPDDSTLPKDAFFIPCLLRDRKDVDPLQRLQGFSTLPLFLYSSAARIPPPLFYRLLTQLSRRFPRLTQLHRNVGYFKIFYRHTLEIALLPYSIQFHVFTKTGGEPRRDICSRIRVLVCKKVEETKQQGMAGLQVCLGYVNGSNASATTPHISEHNFVSLMDFPDKSTQLFAGGDEVEKPPDGLALWYNNPPCQVFKRTDKFDYSKTIKSLLDFPLHQSIIDVAEELDKEDDLEDNWLSLWKKLLERPIKNSVEIQNKREGPTVYLLKRWVQQEGQRATVGKLLAALSAIYRNDVGNLLEQHLDGGGAEETPHPSSDSELPRLSSTVKECVKFGDFRTERGDVSASEGSVIRDSGVKVNVQGNHIGDINFYRDTEGEMTSQVNQQSLDDEMTLPSSKRRDIIQGTEEDSSGDEMHPAKKRKC